MRGWVKSATPGKSSLGPKWIWITTKKAESGQTVMSARGEKSENESPRSQGQAKIVQFVLPIHCYQFHSQNRSIFFHIKRRKHFLYFSFGFRS